MSSERVCLEHNYFSFDASHLQNNSLLDTVDVGKSKKPKLSHSDNQDCNGDAIAGPSNDESTPKIFKLNIDCLEEIFEYLNVKDLHSFGKTCRRMNKVAGEYYKQNYSSADIRCEKDGIYMYEGYVKERISGFNKFIPCISYYGDDPNDDLGPVKYIKSHINEFESTNHIHLEELSINKTRIGYFKKLLPQLEIVRHRECSVDGDFYDLLLKYCKNLKEIHVQNWDVGNRRKVKLNWLLQKYPKLERFELRPSKPCRIEELREFFVRNPNVQRFSTTARFLWKNDDIFLNSNAKLDILELEGFNNYCPSFKGKQTSENILELLNQLHKRDFYKRLYIYVNRVNKEMSTLFTSLEGLELLCIEESFQKSYNLAQLTNLKELIMFGSKIPKYMEILANGLTKLERLYIHSASIGDIMPFIRRSPKLNKIKFIPPYYSTGVVLNLAMLNKERAKLTGARKIIIYTRDDVFLATKWTTRNGNTNLSFIEMRRVDSIKWNHYFQTQFFG
ncbi:uncharacterized protein LOC116347697 [Contarinia nasturtii]|uniref:uncharacterized protein LOC116347697 n=1 Tax=Contarinia nasturtii TaxID=265458 RepID=UPI0012D3D8C9|nr:uncharacterized protein LOC116347697 [Contarinia nasturtii]XP_031634262.1 uncharacterized protein LOC116347697 [Contarinia nasturtii]